MSEEAYVEPKQIGTQFEQRFSELRIRGVYFKYPNAKKPALRDINISIKKGEIVGIIGESGAGKTTLVDLMLGLLKPNSGQIYINSKNDEESYRKYKKALCIYPKIYF